MSLEKVLIIKQSLDTDLTGYKTCLEMSPEHYSVVISNNYHAGYQLLKETIVETGQKLSAVIIDTDEVGSQLMGLLTSLRSIHEYSESDKFLAVIVIAGSVSVKGRQSLSSMSSECVIKTDKTNQYLWHLVKSSLERNSSYTAHSRAVTRPPVKMFIRRNHKMVARSTETRTNLA